MTYLNDENLYSQRGLYEKKWLSSCIRKATKPPYITKNYVLFNN
jgi:hypothetical protein